MINQVLTIDQCKELLALGLDMSDASCMWCPTYKSNGCLVDYDTIEEYNVSFRNNTTPIEVLREKFPLTYKEGNVYYTYTLQDILEKLPTYIVKDYTCYSLDIVFGSVKISYYNQYHEEYLVSFDCDNLLDGAFEILKWCIENKYINKK